MLGRVVQPLIDMFLERIRRRRKTDAARMTAAARRYLETEQWLGNARELQSRIERVPGVAKVEIWGITPRRVGSCAAGSRWGRVGECRMDGAAGLLHRDRRGA